MNKKIEVSKDSALTMIATGNLVEWRGLPQGITPAEMEIFFVPDSNPDSTRLSGQPAIKRIYRSTHQTQPIEAWFKNDVLVLVRIFSPDLSCSTHSLLKTLGDPQTKIKPGPHSTVPMATQWVIAEKGITLYVNEFLKRKLSFKLPDDYIQQIALYQPTSPEDYQNNLGGAETRVKMPLKK